MTIVRTHRASLRITLVVAMLAGLLSAIGVSAAGQAGLVAHGSAKQVYATGLAPNAKVALLDRSGHRVATKSATSLGGVVFYGVKPGSGYRVQPLPHGHKSGPVTVHSEAAAPWDPSAYKQSVPDDGYGYLTTRDGTKLAYTVHPPTAPAGEMTQQGFTIPDQTLPSGLPDYAPPYPTLIEYSGYGYATPSGPTSGIAVLANLMGFAVVDISMRGTGCSGGAFNFFEPLQNLDGYDIIETVARQPWVKNHKVGMLGISYGGISQLFTAALRPPSLAAISPLSVIDATASTLYPGGVLNTGFAVAWAKERQAEAQVAGKPGTQPYAAAQIKAGDKTCAANQALHGEAQDLLATIKQNAHYNPSYADTLDPVTFVHKINVPVFMACQFEDEQTGGHCPTLAEHMTGTSKKWFTFTNGAHIDSLDPQTYNKWYDFLELYVAQQAPITDAALMHAAAPAIYHAAMGIDGITLPPDPIQEQPTFEGALAAFEKLPPVRVLFENGAGRNPGEPYPAFEQSFQRLPVPGTSARSWFFAKGDKLAAA